jgi:hypothetical protein
MVVALHCKNSKASDSLTPLFDAGGAGGGGMGIDL